MANNVNCKEMGFVIRNPVDVDDVSPATVLEIGTEPRDYLDLILPNNGASVFNTRTARGRVLLLDPARGEEKLRESSGSTTAWWWSLQFSDRASPSSCGGGEVLGRGGAAPWMWCCSPPLAPLFIGRRGKGPSPL